MFRFKAVNTIFFKKKDSKLFIFCIFAVETLKNPF